MNDSIKSSLALPFHHGQAVAKDKRQADPEDSVTPAAKRPRQAAKIAAALDITPPPIVGQQTVPKRVDKSHQQILSNMYIDRSQVGQQMVSEYTSFLIPCLLHDCLTSWAWFSYLVILPSEHVQVSLKKRPKVKRNFKFWFKFKYSSKTFYPAIGPRLKRCHL